MSARHTLTEPVDPVDRAGPVDPAGPVAPAEPTTVPGPPDGPAVERRRETGVVRRTDVLALVGAVAAALSLTTLVFTRFAPFDGLLGFLAAAYGTFLAVYTLLVSLDERGPAVRDRLVAVFVHSLASVLVLALVVVIGFTLWRGRQALAHLNFFTDDMRRAGPLQPLDVGGIRHAMVGTLEQILIALVVTVPLGLICAICLSELPGPFSRFVRTIVEAMTALPSILAGLFIYATVILILDVDRSGFAAGLALSVMMLPIIIRAADVVLRLVPGSLREASYAVGASQWRTVWHVVLPTARSGLTTAVILGTARGVGETSPVLITAGIQQTTNLNPFRNPQISLPLATFDMVRSPSPDMIARGFGAAAVLLTVVLLLFVVARVLGGRAPGQLSRGQQRRRAHASAVDAHRFAERARERHSHVRATEEGHA